MRFFHSLFVLAWGRLHVLWPPATQRRYRRGWLLFLTVGACVGTPLTRVLWRGLLLRTAWASNSCDKCSSHGDRGRFSQTNNGRMFICGSPHLGRCMFALVAGQGDWCVCLGSSLMVYLPFPLLSHSVLLCLVFWFTMFWIKTHSSVLSFNGPCSSS